MKQFRNVIVANANTEKKKHYFNLFRWERHACSIEAAARLNPERSVFMIFTSPVGLPMDVNQWSPAVKVLMKYPNIHFRNVQLKELSKHSPIEKWLDTTPIFESFAMYTHISDLVRMLLLYKFGGTYLETDVLLLKNLSLIQHNWMSLQNPKCLNNGAMDFSHEGVGHEFTHDSLGYIINLNCCAHTLYYIIPFTFF